MRYSQRLSSASVSCRLEWRPSRCVIGAMVVLGISAAFCVLATSMPAWAAWPLSASALAFGLRQARKESRLPSHTLFFPGNELPVTLDGVPIDKVTLQWRGTLAFLHWRDRRGRLVRLSWWPDTLPAASRRELRLAASSLDASRQRSAMAP